MRIDRALARDLGWALRAWPIRLYLVLQLAAALAFIDRRGTGTGSTVLLIWAGLAVLLFVAWWAGRHRLAHPAPDSVPQARARSLFAITGVVGLTVWGFGLSVELSLLLLACGFGGWTWTAVRSGSRDRLRALLTRDPRPFVPLLLLVALPKLLAVGPPYLVGAVLALPSGVGQQLLYLIGSFGPLEASLGRPATAAVLAALGFALVHVPLLLDANQGDLVAATANAILWQSGVGLAAVLAYTRHRAVLPIGVAHALAIG